MRNRKNEVLLVLRITRLIFNHEGHTSTTLSTGSGTQRKQSGGVEAKVGLVCGCEFQQRCSRIDSFHNKSLRASQRPVINFVANRNFMFF